MIRFLFRLPICHELPQSTVAPQRLEMLQALAHVQRPLVLVYVGLHIIGFSVL
jgi:hypothetical protein